MRFFLISCCQIRQFCLIEQWTGRLNIKLQQNAMFYFYWYLFVTDLYIIYNTRRAWLKTRLTSSIIMISKWALCFITYMTCFIHLPADVSSRQHDKIPQSFFLNQNSHFNCHFWIQLEKCIKMSSNKPEIGPLVLEIAQWILRRHFQTTSK